jgi:hypothetical protein
MTYVSVDGDALDHGIPAPMIPVPTLVSKIQDCLVDLQDSFASLNKPCFVDGLDKLPRGEMEYAHFLERIWCGNDSPCTWRTSADDFMKIPDDLDYLQHAFASLNKPFSVDDLDKLPKDETEWGDFIEKMI